MKCNRCQYDSNKIDENKPRAMRFCNKANKEMLALCNNILCEECLCNHEHGSGILDCFNCHQSVKLNFCAFCYAVFCELNCFRYHYCPLQTSEYNAKVFKGHYVPLNFAVMSYEEYKNESSSYIIQLHKQFYDEYVEAKFLHKNIDIVGLLDELLELKNSNPTRYNNEVYIQTKFMLYNACYTVEPDWESVEMMCYKVDNRISIVKLFYFKESNPYSIDFHFFNVFKKFSFKGCLPKSSNFIKFIKHTRTASEKTKLVHKQILSKIFPEKKIEHKVIRKLDAKLVDTISKVYADRQVPELRINIDRTSIVNKLNQIFEKKKNPVIGVNMSIADFDEIVGKTYKTRKWFSIPGDGLCAVYATFTILLDLNIYIKIEDIKNKFLELDEQENYFLAYTICQVCDIYGIKVVVFNLDKQRVECRNFQEVSEFQIILYHGNHFDCVVKNKLITLTNFADLQKNLHAFVPVNLSSDNIPLAPPLLSFLPKFKHSDEVLTGIDDAESKSNNSNSIELGEQEPQHLNESVEKFDSELIKSIVGETNGNKATLHGVQEIKEIDFDDDNALGNDETTNMNPNSDNQDEGESIEEDDEEASEEEEEEEEEDEEDESEEEEEIDDEPLSEVDVEIEPCCAWPKLFTLKNAGQLADCLNQFNNTHPNIECLFVGYSNIQKYLYLLSASVFLTDGHIKFLQNSLKFRHNIFAYIFINKILGENVEFGTDVEFTKIDSNRTPDYLRWKNDKHLEIFEFTVVVNPLRANFLKGLSEKGKYDNEVRQYESIGIHCDYYPVVMSLSSDLDTNIKVWEDYGFKVDGITQRYIEDFINLYHPEYNYLYTYGFVHDDLGTEEASDFIQEKLSDEQNWNYVKVKLNKHRFYIAKSYIHRYNFEDGYYYKMNWYKGNKFQVRQLTTNGYSYQEMMKFKNDDYSFSLAIIDSIKGKDVLHLATQTQFNLDQEIAPNIHQSNLETIDKDTIISKNKFNNCVYRYDNILREIEACKKIQMSSLGTRFDITKIKNALEVFHSNLQLYKIQKLNQNPSFVNNPRRSFIALIGNMEDISFSEGISLSKISLHDIKSLAARAILEKSNQVVYEHTTNIDVSENYYAYKTSLSNYYSFVKENGLDIHSKFKFILEKIDKSKQDTLKSLKIKLQEAQKTFQRENTRTDQNGILNIDKTIQETIRKEMDWSRGSQYKLYMNDFKSMDNLFVACRTIVRNLHFRFELPSNDRDLPFFIELKRKPLDEINKAYSEVRDTTLFNTLVFVSRLAYTLFSVSHRNFNKNKVCLDNLGLNNCALIIKGGKKITTTRQTKIFKLIYACNNQLNDWNPTVSSSSILFDETNWMQINQNILFDWISLPYKYLANYMFLREKYDAYEVSDMLMMPTLLALHNRRKTEIMMHNMRYLMVNPLGEWSQVDLMIKEFATPSYTCFENSIKEGIYFHYIDYVFSARKWLELTSNEKESFSIYPVNHPYLSRTLYNIDDLTYVIYSTYLMSKGAYNQSLAQTSNLKNVMETHEYYDSLHGNFELDEIQSCQDQLLNNDFAFSPKLSYAVGKILSAELKSKRAANNLNIKWYQTMNAPIDKIANNHGLRYKGKDFFGHKGYFIVYKQLLEQDLNSILNIINSGLPLNKIYQNLSKVNDTFSSEQKTKPLKKVIMHIVDKSQRAGDREIFVMDYDTKIYQYPIEKMFKFICEYIDNEIITVPSAKRAGLIHHKVFEYRSEKYDTYYLTLDCRKWAPRCNPNKYIYMLLGMIDVLPVSFVNSVISYFNVHSKKEIHTRKHIKEQLLKNPQNRKWEKYFTDSDETESSFFIMPYSFVMGIFNMLSSLFHAGNQILIKNIIEEDLIMKSGRADLDMFAHSDDSAGRLSVIKGTDENLIESNINLYEVLQKAVNHLMSLKKSVVSKNYFELLSILYLNHELLPLLPKFLGNISITFTGQGLSSDFKQIISKSIELTNNGATASQAYKSQIILSNLYRNFYRVETDIKLPSLGGFANSWPTLYLTFGSAVDEVILAHVDPHFMKQILNFATTYLEYEVVDGTLNLKFENILRTPLAYRAIQRKYKLPEIEDKEWFFQNNHTNHAKLNAYWFLSMLKSSNFAVALLNINDIRKAYDSLYMASGHHIKGKFKNYSINSLILNMLSAESKDTYLMQYLKSSYNNLFEYLNWVATITNTELVGKTNFTYKPSTLNLVNFPDFPISNFNSFQLTIDMLRPELKKYTFSNKQYGKELNLMSRYLQNLNINLNDIKTVKSFLDFLNKSKNVQVNYYAPVSSQDRNLNGIIGLHNLILNNYHSNYRILDHSQLNLLETHIQFKIDRQYIDYITACFFYFIWKKSHIDQLSSLPIKITDLGQFELNNILSACGKGNLRADWFTLMNLIEYDEGRKIVLNNIDNWAIWLDRQVRVGTEWVGKGKILFKIKSNYFILHTRNREITKVTHKSRDPVIFDATASYFINEILNDSKLNLYSTVVADQNDLYFGVNNEGVLGLHNGTNIRLGIQNTHYDNWIDVSIFDNAYTHSFNYGKHYIEKQGSNEHVYTLDEIIFNKNRKNIIELIEWEGVNKREKEILFEIFMSGKYGSLPELNYDKKELLERILQTDIYRLYYNKTVKQKINLYNVFWGDIITQAQHSLDIFPSLYENLPVSNLEKLLPSSDKEKIELLTYYEIEDRNVLNFWTNINRFSSDAERIAYASTILKELKEQGGLVLLPDIGDPNEFMKYECDIGPTPKLPIYVIQDLITTVAEALLNSFNTSNNTFRKKIFNLYKKDLRNFDDFLSLFYDLNHTNIVFDDYIGLTVKQMVVHELIENSFEDKMCFIEYSKSFRGTQFRNIPRHPVYKMDHHKLIANVYKYVNKFRVKDYPAQIQRYFMKTKNLLGKLQEFREPNETLTEMSFPPILGHWYDLSKIQLDATPKEKLDNNINTLNYQEVKESLLDYESLREDLEVYISLKRKLEPSRLIIPSSQRDAAHLIEETKNEKTQVASLCFVPKQKCYTFQLGNNQYFVYNINPDTANKLKLKPCKLGGFNQLYNQYIEHYVLSGFDLSRFQELAQFSPEVKLPTPSSRIIETKFNVTDPTIYDSRLYNYLKETFEIEDEDILTDIDAVINSNTVPSVKIIKLKSIINQYSRGRISSRTIENFISDFLKENFGKIKIGGQTNNIQDALKLVDTNKNKLIEETTSYKKEFKQYNTILDFKFGKILTDEVIISEGTKQHLISNLKILIKQMAMMKKKNEAAHCRLLLESLITIKTGVPNTEGLKFDELVRNVMTDIAKLLDEESEESEPDEPEYKNDAWNLRI
uniref:RNA-directed RNA polymerase L n=1 Tax=Macrophomina phaseolina mycobunyavirus 1 TaxID=2741661 RepID=A0A7U3W8K1_9VIRU|nr:RNA-dependent RNA polymerase [Macrophomina phaseolina mycobunyavirus 1]